MRICIIGDFSENPDEGMKNVAFYLTQEVSKQHETAVLNIKNIFSFGFWKNVKNYDPQIVHFLTGPGICSFIFLKSLTLFWKDAKTVMSSLHYTRQHFLIRKFIPLFKPHLILTQSREYDEIFQKLSCRTKFLPNGVDTKRFVFVSNDRKEKLREKYGLNQDKFIILHVGHLIEVRNLHIFKKIQQECNNQVIIVASAHFKSDEKLYKSLIKEGCIIWSGYFKNIEEIYALSDCYIFPVRKGYSILTPLSVMEAMSCNLPVVSSKFDGLMRTFEEGNGLLFAETEEDFIQKLKGIKSGEITVKTREKVLLYSWVNVAEILGNIYGDLMLGREP